MYKKIHLYVEYNELYRIIYFQILYSSQNLFQWSQFQINFIHIFFHILYATLSKNILQ